MTYIIDTHILIWYLDKNKRLKPEHHAAISDPRNKLIISTIVLAEIKHLISIKRINVDFDMVIDALSGAPNCIIYPVDEHVINEMPPGLNIHDALIVSTGLVYRNILGENAVIITVDEDIIKSKILTCH